MTPLERFWRRLSKPLSPRARLSFGAVGATMAGVVIAGVIEKRLFLAPHEGSVLTAFVLIPLASVPIGFELAWRFGSRAWIRRAASLGPALMVVCAGASLLAASAFPPWWNAAVPLLGILGVHAQQRALREAAAEDGLD